MLSWKWIWAVFLAISSALFATSMRGDEPTVTVWLMPSEPADEQLGSAGISVDQQIDEFSRQFPHVTILNAVDPYLRAQLIAWSPEFAQAAWPMLKGQKHTLGALERFAQDHHVRIHFRLESWATAFGDLEVTRNPPDVVQIGSTWVANLVAAGKIREGSPDGLHWRATPSMPQASLLYTTDVRLIFYWRRPPGSDSSGPVFVPRTETWESVLNSLTQYVESTSAKPMVLPIGVTQNLLHDYAPLVWAGEADILRVSKWRAHSDLGSAAALHVPQMLARKSVVMRAGQPFRLLAFPEMDHEEATRHFMAGDYLAILEPAAFIRRWFDNYTRQDTQTSTLQSRLVRAREFWSHAGIATPPVTFKGGADLVVLNTTEVPELSVSLARFLVQDSALTHVMGSIGWLPAQVADHGLGTLDASLWVCGDAGDACQSYPDDLPLLNQVVQKAIETGREYPEYENWPVTFESRQTLDQLQDIWRAMGEADQAGIAARAADVELSINQRIDWWSRSLMETKRVLPTLAVVLLLLAVPLTVHEIRRARRSAEEEREKNVALGLVLAEDHGRMRAYGWALNTLEENTQDSAMLREVLRRYGGQVTRYGSLVTDLVNELSRQLAEPSTPEDLGDLATRSMGLAQAEFEASFPTLAYPQLALECAPQIREWQISRFSALLVLVLSEWFFNCLKDMSGTDIQHGSIKITVCEGKIHTQERHKTELVIVSPTLIPPERAVLFGRPPKTPHESPGRGIRLMSDLLWYGFRATAECTPLPDERCTRLAIRIRLKRRFGHGSTDKSMDC